jgi:hypothetical protein
MPLVETLPVGADTAQWPVWGTVARIVVTEPAKVTDAAAIVRACRRNWTGSRRWSPGAAPAGTRTAPRG